MELRMVLVPSAAKRHCRPCASFHINLISNFTALSHLWQHPTLQIDQLEARSLGPKESPLKHQNLKLLRYVRVVSLSLQHLRLLSEWRNSAP